MKFLCLICPILAFRKNYDSWKVLRGNWKNNEISEKILKFLNDIEEFDLWSKSSRLFTVGDGLFCNFRDPK